MVRSYSGQLSTSFLQCCIHGFQLPLFEFTMHLCKKSDIAKKKIKMKLFYGFVQLLAMYMTYLPSSYPGIFQGYIFPLYNLNLPIIVISRPSVARWVMELGVMSMPDSELITSSNPQTEI